MGHLRLTTLHTAPNRASFARAAARSDWKRGALGAAVVLVGSATLFGVPPPIHPDAPGARAAIETLIATSALVSAGLLLASFRQGRRRSDLLLLTALGVVGLTDFVFLALPALTGAAVFAVGSGSEIASHALVAVAFAAAAFTSAGKLSQSVPGPLRVAGAVAAATIGLATVTDLIAGQPALGVTSTATGFTAAAAHPVLLADAIFSAAVLLAAGIAFFCRPGMLSRALGTASFLLAAARLQYLALPEVAPGWITAREGLRLAAYGLLLVVAASRFAQSRRDIAAATLAIERERIARDLHDGLAQDLTYIALQGQRLSSELGPEHPLTQAARRAVAASRGVIVDLSASGADSVDAALRQVADELGARFGTDIDVRLPSDGDGAEPTELPPGQREDVVRIAREAIINAARHGGADHVRLVLDSDDGEVRLRVSDDGLGMSQAKPNGRGGFGLQMMRARASALGGRLAIHAAEQGGVEVEVTFPRQRAGTR